MKFSCSKETITNPPDMDTMMNFRELNFFVKSRTFIFNIESKRLDFNSKKCL